MARERMPEHVRADGHLDALPGGPIPDPLLYGARADAGAALTHEQGLIVG